ncbi:hypothetical protein SCP_1103500 [Sparassis crispa]|uniref:Uncharacterized protein n=1 Tax=Sparassis crispa TaxID=139825 RepID=A0A401GZT2_9APHY|nr:hypothetical protein SCP_1103500 [Sparassis crispa]GBE87673.1 hypothetical protein SCP_1103500 [Sparassis crispa]
MCQIGHLTWREMVHSHSSWCCSGQSPPAACGSSDDPRACPACDLGTLQAPEDLPVISARDAQGFKFALWLEEEMRKLVYLCATARPKDQSDEDLGAFIVHGARTTYQFSSTCRMAPLF